MAPGHLLELHIKVAEEQSIVELDGMSLVQCIKRKKLILHFCYVTSQTGNEVPGNTKKIDIHR